MHLVHLLFAEASSEMVLLECWVSLRKGNEEKRLSYAKSHKKWFENQWEQFLWRDESKFVHFGLNHQHGGCISVSGVRDLVKIDEIKEEEKYSQIWQFTPCSDILKLSVWQWLRFSP